MEQKTILSNDPKVIELLKYLGVKLNLTQKVLITVECNMPVIVEEKRIAAKQDNANP